MDPYPRGERYAALRSLEGDTAAEAVIQALKTAGLRGMGGAGFPTGAKWEMVRGAAGAPKYVVCNADESEPGTFKDRQILEEAPHLVLEGMGLAARIIGAAEGILFLRHEYGRAREAVERELPAYQRVPGGPPPLRIACLHDRAAKAGQGAGLLGQPRPRLRRAGRGDGHASRVGGRGNGVLLGGGGGERSLQSSRR